MSSGRGVANRTSHIAGDVVVVLIGVLFVVPFVWLIVSALTPSATLAISSLNHITFDNLIQVFQSKSNLQSFGVSLYLSIGTMLLTTIISIMAAYPLSRYSLRFKKAFTYIMIFATGLPAVALMIPVYDLYVSWNMINSQLWTVIFLTATSLPFSAWIMKGFVDSVPIELEEAAWVEGAGTFTSFVRMVIPLVLPGASVVAVFTFVNVWGNFLVPFILLQAPTVPAAVTIYQFFGQYSVNYSGLAAFAIIYTIPAVVLYVIATKWIGGNFALAGAVKG